MVNSPILNLPEIIQSSPQFDQAANDANLGIECATNDVLTLDMAPGNRTIGDTEQLRAFFYRCTGVNGQTLTLSSQITLVLEARRFLCVHNDEASVGALTVNLAGNGTFSDVLLPGNTVLYYIKGAEIFTVSRFGTGAQAPSLTYEVSTFLTDQPPAGQKEVLRLPITQNIQFLANFQGSVATSRLNAAQATVFTILRNDIEVGNVTFNTNGSNVFTTSNPAAPVTFSAGQVLTIKSSPLQDASLADVGINLLGSKL
jgi:hypothetical protein